MLALVLVILTVGASAAFGGWALWRFVTAGYVFTAPHRGPVVTVVVPSGASLSEIADILAEHHVVLRAGPFESRAEADGYAARFRPGTYRFHQYEAYKVIVAGLTKGGVQNIVTVTVPEGFTCDEIATLAARRVRGFSGAEYRRLTSKNAIDAQVPGMKAGTRLEGLMFPAQFSFPPLKTPRDLVENQFSSFQDAFAQLDITRASKRHLSAYDVVIIASMVEREVKVPSERPLVAAVIWNRLRINMLLQVDPTVMYGLHKPGTAPTLHDLTIDSPYNTYLHKGLPPTPICNPGLPSLEAAAQPAHVGYLYYVARRDGSGRHYFATTYQEFLADKAKAGL